MIEVPKLGRSTKKIEKTSKITNGRSNDIGLLPFQDGSPVLGTNYLEFDRFVPNNGTAVLKRLRSPGQSEIF